MKRLLATTALALLPFGAIAADLPARSKAPAPVFTNAPTFDAFGSVALGYNSWDVAGISPEGLNVEGRATFATTLSGAFGVQFDGTFERARYDDSVLPLTNNTGSLAGHLFWRDSNAGLVGVIAQGNAKSSTDVSDRQYFLGLEGQYYIGNVTLYGQAAYQNLGLGFAGESLDADGLALAGQVRYFATPNFMMALKGGYSSLSFNGVGPGIDHDAWAVGAKAEYRFAASPVSVFVEGDYRRGTLKGDVGPGDGQIKGTEQRVMVGAKWNLGSQTLLQRDRSGASLDPLRSLAPPTLPMVSQ